MKTLVVIVVVTLVACGLGIKSSAVVVKQDGHIEWVVDALKEMESIKEGMTRKDLLRVFTTEGGLSTPSWQRYVYKKCPLFKVEVEFQTRKDESGRGIESPDDRITKISKPFIERTIVDD